MKLEEAGQVLFKGMCIRRSAWTLKEETIYKHVYHDSLSDSLLMCRYPFRDPTKDPHWILEPSDLEATDWVLCEQDVDGPERYLLECTPKEMRFDFSNAYSITSRVVPSGLPASVTERIGESLTGCFECTPFVVGRFFIEWTRRELWVSALPDYSPVRYAGYLTLQGASEALMAHSPKECLDILFKRRPTEKE